MAKSCCHTLGCTRLDRGSGLALIDPAARQRMREALEVAERQPLVLIFGGIRPYKNIETVLSALCVPALHETALVVAGRETGYTEPVAAEPIGRTRAHAAALGVSDRVRFLPGRLDLEETSALFEAADIMALPYIKSYGSAALLLGMTFGKHIVATRTGGMEEYLTQYPRHTLLDGSDPASVVRGLVDAVTCSQRAESNEVSLLRLTWSSIAREVLAQLNDRRVAGKLFRSAIRNTLAPGKKWASISSEVLPSSAIACAPCWHSPAP